MIFNALFWSRYFQAEFVPQIKAIPDTLEKRVLPGFENIEEESKRISEYAWQAFMSMPTTGDEDPADYAEEAKQAGVSHYLMLDGIRQGMINLFAAALYHLFEQQIMLFHRREVLTPAEENDHALLTFSQFQSRLARSGVDIKAFSSWAKLEELRLVANAGKHAEGYSAKRLHKLRADLFQTPHLEQLGLLGTRDTRLFQPIIGEDMYVSLMDIHNYRTTLITFWQELSDVMQCA